MKIGLGQIEVRPGAPEKNMETMLTMIEQAKQEKLDLIAFPELCISGYLLSDLWLNREFCLDMMTYNERIRNASEGIAIAYGNIFVDENINRRLGDDNFYPNKDGRVRKYNAIYIYQNGKACERLKETHLLPQGVQPKTLFPNYRFFDDERYFFSLENIAKDMEVTLESLLQPFFVEIQGDSVPIGFEICEDLWCNDYRKSGRPINVTKGLVENGAQLIVNLSGSPWTYGKNNARDRRVRFLEQDVGKDSVPFLYVNNVGAQNNGKNIITFDGGSTVYNAKGLPVMFNQQPYQPELLLVDDQSLEKVTTPRIELPKIALKYKAIITGIQHVKIMNGWEQDPDFVVGMSGGIDSSVVAALLVLAVGKEKVLGVNMPTIYNTDKTKNAAKQVAEKLEIEYWEVPIQKLTESHQEIFKELDSKHPSSEAARSLSDENIQAKIRGSSILSNIAGRYGRMLTNNGNKVEIALGYVTLYGDVNGSLAPIGDLTKSEVYQLAEYLNNEIFEHPVFPPEMLMDDLFIFDELKIAPSAELKNQQVDPMKFGYHCALVEALTNFIRKTPEDILNWYLEGTLEQRLQISHSLIQRWGIDDPEVFAKDLEWVTQSIQKNVFKRIQSPPIIVTSKSAYGYDLRESQLGYHQTRKYRSLKKKVLTLKKYQPQSQSQIPT
ncbi:MAG: NAD(+) synthase [Bacteroidetes bacterium]|nr:NAD(+) synthase [Bacteroidota bacterium]